MIMQNNAIHSTTKIERKKKRNQSINQETNELMKLKTYMIRKLK